MHLIFFFLPDYNLHKINVNTVLLKYIKFNNKKYKIYYIILCKSLFLALSELFESFDIAFKQSTRVKELGDGRDRRGYSTAKNTHLRYSMSSIFAFNTHSAQFLGHLVCDEIYLSASPLFCV